MFDIEFAQWPETKRAVFLVLAGFFVWLVPFTPWRGSDCAKLGCPWEGALGDGLPGAGRSAIVRLVTEGQED
jgi:hypothetical protein